MKLDENLFKETKRKTLKEYKIAEPEIVTSYDVLANAWYNVYSDKDRKYDYYITSKLPKKIERAKKLLDKYGIKYNEEKKFNRDFVYFNDEVAYTIDPNKKSFKNNSLDEDLSDQPNLTPIARRALDGKVWWVAYDEDKKDYSSIVTIGKYKTKKDCQYAIDKFYKQNKDEYKHTVNEKLDEDSDFINWVKANYNKKYKRFMTDDRRYDIVDDYIEEINIKPTSKIQSTLLKELDNFLKKYKIIKEKKPNLKESKQLNEGIIDSVLDRVEGIPYNVREFYHYVNGWYNEIASALDNGTEDDIRNEIIKAVKQSIKTDGGDPENSNAKQLYSWIKKAKWLENTNEIPEKPKYLRESRTRTFKQVDDAIASFESFGISEQKLRDVLLGTGLWGDDDVEDIINQSKKDRGETLDEDMSEPFPNEQDYVDPKSKANFKYAIVEFIEGGPDLDTPTQQELRKATKEQTKFTDLDKLGDLTFKSDAEVAEKNEYGYDKCYIDFIGEFNGKTYRVHVYRTDLGDGLKRKEHLSNEDVPQIEEIIKKEALTKDSWRTRQIDEELELSFELVGSNRLDDKDEKHIEYSGDLEYLKKQATKYSDKFSNISIIDLNTGKNVHEYFKEKLETTHSGDEILSAPKQGPDSGMAKIINDLIIDEWAGIDAYNSAIVTAQAEKMPEIAGILTEIQNEENVHVGQLQKCMELLTRSVEKISDGEEEAGGQIKDVLNAQSEPQNSTAVKQ